MKEKEHKIVVWGLFDSGNGSYYKAANEFENIKSYSIGNVINFQERVKNESKKIL